jgi:hypothetical protein
MTDPLERWWQTPEGDWLKVRVLGWSDTPGFVRVSSSKGELTIYRDELRTQLCGCRHEPDTE